MHKNYLEEEDEDEENNINEFYTSPQKFMINHRKNSLNIQNNNNHFSKSEINNDRFISKIPQKVNPAKHTRSSSMIF